MDSATLRAHFEKFTKPDTPRKNGLAQLPLPATPQLMDSATLRAHFEKFTNLTPLEKNGLSLMNMHYANDMQMSRQTESLTHSLLISRFNQNLPPASNVFAEHCQGAGSGKYKPDLQFAPCYSVAESAAMKMHSSMHFNRRASDIT